MAQPEGVRSPLTVYGHACFLSNALIFTNIDIYELVGVRVEDEYENNQRQYTTTATFRTARKIPASTRQCIFRLTSADGTKYIIGTGQIPHPVVKEKEPYPEKPADTTLNTVTVIWKAVYPMLKVLG